ncbi:DUF1593 domain-containing protein [Pelagicoccus sp. SDUM812002]|uniref:DUF1593 domain-containing protein n=1 Tax=Pelagicoccus sp. SDUM812002 TaxID=3041266 RepID=UPI00280C96A2|nr:DUF1593 domain-containing protein [Pelagicoccus sp. SDUM812002]MDQ8185728.1 DUF1593 domain-containing protein [Pelagicoccus sp. SDUM812002]
MASDNGGRPRVVISTDIGGSDNDDYQSMVHYLVCADVFDTEGLISSPPHAGRVGNILECIDLYEKDYPRLKSYSSSYPTADYLRSVSRQGAIEAQSGEVPTEGDLSAGAKLLIDRANYDDPRPLYVLVWGSITDVAQAVRADPGIKAKLRIYSIGSWNTVQDKRSRDYLFNEHLDLWWIENDTTFRGMYMGGDQSGELSNERFPEAHVAGHGHLGSLFMEKLPVIKMGDTPSVLYLLHGDPDAPTANHWGGAFVQPYPDRPTYWHDDPNPSFDTNGRAGAKTVSKWRADYLRDWKMRMDRVQFER